MPPKKKKSKSLVSYKGKAKMPAAKSAASHGDEDGTFTLEWSRSFCGKWAEDLADLGNRFGVGSEAMAELETILCMNGGGVPVEMRDKYKEKCINQYEEVAIPNDGPDSECVFFSGQTDRTKFRATDSWTNKQTSTSLFEHHISLVGEPGGRFLGHMALDIQNDAEEVANGIWELLEKQRYHLDLLIIGGDPQRTNTDPDNGVFYRIQEKKGHRLTVAVCMLESLKKMLRSFIQNRLISPAVARYLETCKLAFPDTPRPYNPNFEPIPAKGVFFPEGPEEDFTEEENYVYRIWPIITRKGDVGRKKTGPFIEDVTLDEFLEFGPGYWDKDLKEANAFLRLYINKYELSGKDACNLKDIVHFIIYFFYPSWFRVRGDETKLVDAPALILEELKSIRNHVPEEIKEDVKAVVEAESWMAHPEILLLHILASDDAEVRKFAVDQILRLRGPHEFGNTANRPFLPPKLNWEAETVKDLIDWQEIIVTEPIQTAKLSIEEIRRFLELPMTMRAFTCHGNSLKKIKHQMKNASEEVIGIEARNEMVHRRCDPKILMARKPEEIDSGESDSDYDPELYTNTRKKRENDDDDGGGAHGASGLPQLSGLSMV